MYERVHLLILNNIKIIAIQEYVCPFEDYPTTSIPESAHNPALNIYKNNLLKTIAYMFSI